MTDTVIKIDNVSKEYRLGIIGHGTLGHDLQSWWARVKGKEDPNSLISPGIELGHMEGKRFLALQNISLTVEQGDVLGLIGSNGAGKSTLLKLLSRVTAPTSGTISIQGRIASLLEVGTGFHPELTGLENIYLNGAILGMSKGEIKAKLDQIIDFSGIDTFIDTPVKRYSSGMYVRLAFAVAAHLEPEILVVDEVLAVGDVDFQKKCLGKMKEVSQEGRTVIFVSHNMPSIKKLCSRAVLLSKGTVAADGYPEDIVRDYVGGNSENCLTYTNRPESRLPHIRHAAISQDGKQKEIFDMDSPIDLEIEIDRNDNANLTIGIIIRDEEGMSIHHSSDEFLQPGSSFVSETQRRCRLPAYALRKGRFVVDLSLGERNVDLFQNSTGILVFEVGFTGKMSDRITGNWEGVCGPGLIEWQ